MHPRTFLQCVYTPICAGFAFKTKMIVRILEVYRSKVVLALWKVYEPEQLDCNFPCWIFFQLCSSQQALMQQTTQSQATWKALADQDHEQEVTLRSWSVYISGVLLLHGQDHMLCSLLVSHSTHWKKLSMNIVFPLYQGFRISKKIKFLSI